MKKRGFTLLELMIALGIFMLFSVYMFQAFNLQTRQTFRFNNNIELQYNVNKAMNMITDDLRNNLSQNLTDVTFDSTNQTLTDSDGIVCNYIININIVKGDSSDNEDELVNIIVNGKKDDTEYTSTTSININK
ncbi:MAG: type II secretion system protein J [Clostridiaceae bacterium]